MLKYTTMMDNADQSGEGVKIYLSVILKYFILLILGTVMNTDSAGRGWIRRATNFRQL